MRKENVNRVLPECPCCGSKNTVGKVLSYNDMSCGRKYYCLIEFNWKGIILVPYLTEVGKRTE